MDGGHGAAGLVREDRKVAGFFSLFSGVGEDEELQAVRAASRVDRDLLAMLVQQNASARGIGFYGSTPLVAGRCGIGFAGRMNSVRENVRLYRITMSLL